MAAAGRPQWESQELVARSCTVWAGRPAAKLRVFVDAPTELLVERLARDGFPLREAELERLKCYHRQLGQLANEPGQGPLLHIRGGDLDWAHTEIVAAVGAMT